MLPPRFIMRATVAQMQEFISTPAAQNPFVAAFAERLAAIKDIPEAKRAEQQAIDYGIEASEVDRYVVNPGQACAHMVGQLKIVELRDKAQRMLGARYSPKAFHNVVLLTGSVPLPLLEQTIDAYIRSVAGK